MRIGVAEGLSLNALADVGGYVVGVALLDAFEGVGVAFGLASELPEIGRIRLEEVQGIHESVPFGKGC